MENFPGPEQADEGADRLNRGLIAAVAIGMTLLVGFQLDEYRTFGKHETFAAVPAREMLRTGDWIVPRFGGLPRLEKPPLAYWVIAACGTLFGGVTEWTARLPAAVSTLALSALVGFWGGRWYGRLVGAGSAVALGSSVFAMTYGRRAEVDMLLCLLTTSALFLIANQPSEERGWRAFLRWTGISLFLALSWLAKFQYGFVMVILPTIAYAVVMRRWRILWHACNPLGIAMLAFAATAWTHAVVARVPEATEIWRKQTVGRVAGALGAEPWWLYLQQVPVLLLPWTPLILLAVPGSYRKAWSHLSGVLLQRDGGRLHQRCLAAWRETSRDDARERFLWTALIVQFAVLFASAAKHSHYAAAAIPMLALLAGQGIRTVAGRLQDGSFRWTRGLTIGCSLLVLAASAGIAVSLSHRWPFLTSVVMVLCGVMAVGGVLSAWLLDAGRFVAACHVVNGAFVASSMLASAYLIPAEDYRRPAAEYSNQVRMLCGEDQRLYVYRMGADPVVFYLDDNVQRVESSQELASRLRSGTALRVVTRVEREEELAALGSFRVISRMPEAAHSRRSFQLMLVELRPAAPAGPIDVRNADRSVDSRGEAR